jgi:hypothetical protein
MAAPLQVKYSKQWFRYFCRPGRFKKMNSLRAILGNLLMILKAHTYSRKLMGFLYLWGMSTIMEIAGTVLVNLC